MRGCRDREGCFRGRSNCPDCGLGDYLTYGWSIALGSEVIEDIINMLATKLKTQLSINWLRHFLFCFNNDAFIDWSQ
ncbi:DUF7716 domain-containing protein [Burkholderia cepacia]|uniref:DUF7716 domain-containing protein n=1 Tax=Burkholderia cepacia TaxID=292 RepID=UPI0040468A97